MKSGATSFQNPFRVDLLWGPEVLAGAALAVVDVLRSINALAAMRTPRAPQPVAWLWVPMASGRAPGGVARSPAFRGQADAVVVPGWHANSGPHLDRLVQAARDRAAAGRLPGAASAAHQPQALGRPGAGLMAQFLSLPSRLTMASSTNLLPWFWPGA